MQSKSKKAKLSNGVILDLIQDPGPISNDSSSEAKTLTSIPHNLMRYIVDYFLDDSSLVALSTTCKRFADIVAPSRLYMLARQGDIDAICLMLATAKQRDDNLKFFEFLVVTPTPGLWLTREGCQRYLDTLVQLVWRMRDMRMLFRVFNQLKGTYGKNHKSEGLPYFLDLIQKQLSNVEGKQSTALELFGGHLTKYQCDRTPDEDGKIWRSKVGSAQRLVWREMPWVLHLLCTEKSGWRDKDFSKHYKRDMSVARELFTKQTRFGLFGRHWVLVRGEKTSPIQAEYYDRNVDNMIKLLRLVARQNKADLTKSPLLTRKIV